MSVHHVQQFQIDDLWPKAEKYVKSALDHNEGEMTIEQARFALTKSMVELFIFHEGDTPTGAALVEFINYANYRVANVIAVGGKGVIKDWDEFKGWMKQGGAKYVEGYCRDSVCKLWETKFNAKKAYTVMRSEI